MIKKNKLAHPRNPGKPRKKFVDIVVPSYNEAGNIDLLAERVLAQQPPGYHFRLIFVDDGSKDDTLLKIQSLAAQNRSVEYLSFSRNFGHQVALKAGLDHSDADCTISLDADLQHPPEIIPKLLSAWEGGYEIVYTLRIDAQHLGFFKKFSARIFYGLMRSLSGLKIEHGAADYRLLDRKVVQVMQEHGEHNLFIRGLISQIGFRKKAIPYEPEPRHWGESKYTLRKMFLFALDGITSFSIKPLHLATLLGLVFSGLAAAYGLYAVCLYLFTDRTISGWTSVLVSILFVGGLQLVMLGIIGEYLGKLFMQAKHRPNYIISESNISVKSHRRLR